MATILRSRSQEAKVCLARGLLEARHGSCPGSPRNRRVAGGFLKTYPSLDRPDIQLHFCIAPVDNHGRNWNLARGYCVHVCVLRPRSRALCG